MKTLLIFSAALEGATGLALMVAPSLLASLLLGVSLDQSGLVMARVAGAALLALALACWLGRSGGRNGIVASLLLYNVAVAAVLAHARLTLGMSGLGLWPAVVLHVVLAVCCVSCPRPTHSSNTLISRA